MGPIDHGPGGDKPDEGGSLAPGPESQRPQKTPAPPSSDSPSAVPPLSP
jgi:hypothetical protein